VSKWSPRKSPRATRRNDLDTDERWARIFREEGVVEVRNGRAPGLPVTYVAVR
jgi:hypothetical protein